MWNLTRYKFELVGLQCNKFHVRKEGKNFVENLVKLHYVLRKFKLWPSGNPFWISNEKQITILAFY